MQKQEFQVSTNKGVLWRKGYLCSYTTKNGNRVNFGIYKNQGVWMCIDLLCGLSFSKGDTIKAAITNCEDTLETRYDEYKSKQTDLVAKNGYLNVDLVTIMNNN